jgi:hypothetical protein
MRDPFDTDEAVRVARSHGLAILVGLSQLQEVLSLRQNEDWYAEAVELAQALEDRGAALQTVLSDLKMAIKYGTATTPTPDSLEEETGE